jgi:hypothetical protein
MDTGFLEGKGLGARGMLISDCGMRRAERDTGRNKGDRKKKGD